MNGNEILNNENTILRKQLNKYSKRKENIRTTTWKFDREGNKKLETETTNSLDEETITKETTTSLSNDLSNNTNNDNN